MDRARSTLAAGQFAEAEAEYRALCDARPDLPGGWHGLAQVSQAQGDWPAALERWVACLQRFDRKAPLGWRLSQAWALLHCGRLTEAQASFAALTEAYPDDSGPLAGHALCLMRQECWQEAVPLWAALLERFPGAAKSEWRLSYARCLACAGRDAEAAAYSDLLARDPQNAKTHHAYVWHLDRTERAAAVAASQRALAAVPDDLRLLEQAAWIALKNNDDASVQAALRAWIAAADTVAPLHDVMALLPSAFQGWERTSLWLDIEARARALATDAPPARLEAELLILRLKLALRDYPAFLALLEQIPEGTVGGWIDRFRRIAPRLAADYRPDFSRPKLFGIGLARTGTTSLMRAADLLGFNAAHNVNYFTGEMLRLEDALLFDAMGDVPVCTMFEALYHLFPNARFVYTTRPLETWVASLDRHIERRTGSAALRPATHDLHGFDPLTAAYGAGDTSNGVMRALLSASLFTGHASHAATRAAFEARMRAFFAAHDPSRLLVFNLFTGDGWEKLCRFVDRPAPSVPFPAENKGAR
jgi:tetratricopeptide (TPR) repeat protein